MKVHPRVRKDGGGRRSFPRVLWLASLLFLAAACGPDEVAGTADELEPDSSPPSPPSPLIEPTASPTSTGALLELSAVNIDFDENVLAVPVGSRVVILFTNNDEVPHNFALYRTDQASEALFVGDTITGPDETIEYKFTAPSEPGSYFFRCDVHPQQMTGEFLAQ